MNSGGFELGHVPCPRVQMFTGCVENSVENRGHHCTRRRRIRCVLRFAPSWGVRRPIIP